MTSDHTLIDELRLVLISIAYYGERESLLTPSLRVQPCENCTPPTVKQKEPYTWYEEGIKYHNRGRLGDQLSQFLFKHQNTPHSTSGISPAEILIGCQINSRWQLLHPFVTQSVQNQQPRQKLYYDKWATERLTGPNQKGSYMELCQRSKVATLNSDRITWSRV
ncbi:integrase core domain protein [Plakobranchus ocellatus]|uniref:Integrase core domain protein n=1 Tax=Plakobranchus ocellatus TaxID=259542 RepID=A0AAV4BBM3_9GAST|nr:integrase core domain protein [Plakobranchus ocellatus]